MKLYITTFLLSASLFSVNAQNNLQKAEMQFDMRNYSLAVTSYEQALANDPDNQEIAARIAQAYVQLQDYLKASQWYEKFIDSEDVKPEHLVAYGDVLKSLRLYAKAKFYYQKIGQYDPKLASFFVQSCDLAQIEMNGDPYYKINVLNINSRFTDFSPFLFHDDLIFSSLREDIPVAQTRKSRNGRTKLSIENSVFISEKHGTKEIAHFKNMAQGEEVISHVTYSEDGKWVAFQKSDFREGQRLFDSRPGKQSLYVAKVSSNGQWSDVKPYQYNGNDYSTGYPTFSPDASVLYFASTRPGGYGGWDIYLSFRSLNGWTSPQNLGAVVNTTGNEVSPFYSDHNLFFSSDRHPGIGGFDIFKATSQEGQWTNVHAMGYPLNSPKDDIDFVWDPIQKMGYFSSNRIGTTGAYDIFSCTPLYEEIMMTVMEQDGDRSIKGATISFRGATAAPLATDNLGQVIIHQRFGETSSLTISHPEYKDLNMTLKAPGEGPVQYDVYIDKSLTNDESAVAATNSSRVGNDQNDIPVTKSNNSASAQTSDQSKEISEGTGTTTAQTSLDKSAQKGTKPAATTTAVSTEQKAKVTAAKPVSDNANAQSSISTSQTATKKVSPPKENKPMAGMYAVQIAAIGKSTSLDKYGSLSTIGKVMQYPEKGMYKIRVGYYQDIAQARNALRSIKASGYPDAFIVKANPGSEVAVDSRTEQKPPVVSSSNSGQTKDYIVRLGTYSRPEFFDASKIEHLGEVGTYKSGKYTIMLLRGYSSYADADQARIASARQGFGDAYIVIEKNGGLHKVTQ